MAKHPSILKIRDEVVIEREGIQQLLDILNGEGYQTVGPIIRDKAIVYDQVRSISDLPVGWLDFQDAGTYRLEKTDTETLFGYALGPQSWKKYLHPPVIQIWQAERTDRGFRVLGGKEEIPKYAFIGVRSCEISAIAILDRVFNAKEFSDPIYNLRREKIFVLAVNCSRPGATCFCVSMNTGPKARFGFDIAITEVLDEGRCYYVAEVGSRAGANFLGKIPHGDLEEKQKKIAESILEEASRQMGRSLNTSNLKSIFYQHFEHPRWEEVAGRCLTCSNCTMVCPTCFCSNIEERNTLDGAHAERWRKWDSCFSKDFAYIHGGSIRASEKSRYRQWLTHKLSTWIEQFGTLGCVGCGRCITWCPVGIDITEEAKTILEGRADSG